METSLIEPLVLFCRRHGVKSPFEVQPIRAGRNSQVSLLHNEEGCWIHKHYYQPLGDDWRDRIGTEYGFLEFLEQSGVVGVPRPLGMDRSSNQALYSFLPGRRPDVVHSSHISQAAGFVLQLNRLRSVALARRLPIASDACLHVQAHLDLVETRISRLLGIQPVNWVEHEAHDFVDTRLRPLWARVRIKLALEFGQALIPSDHWVLSPSDFGFHNTLEHEGSLSFVDFEYAGWDDPAKLICDFICQPELPITESQGQQFMMELLQELPGVEELERRVQELLPVHRLKWCCILLNELRIENRQRREHAGIASDDMLTSQLGKAKWYFDKHLSALS
jgi:hypothetical protein